MLWKDIAPSKAKEEGPEEKWYAIHVRPRCELSIAANLRKKGYDPFIPQYKCKHQWSDRTVKVECPLFRGYIFCPFDVKRRMPILTTPGVLRIVGNGKIPVALAVEEIEAVRKAVESGCTVRPHPYLAAGARVRIGHGVLAGLAGKVEDSWNRSLIISIDLIQQSIIIDIENVLPLNERKSGIAPR